MPIVGILPASGKASRIGGIPKFALPVSDDRSILQWHVNQMLEVCDEVRVCTRPEWVPIVKNMDMNIKLVVHEPTTMSEAVKFLVGNYNDTVLVGMPDTYMHGTNTNIYKSLLYNTSQITDLSLGLWRCREELRGRVGQILCEDGIIKASKDKDPECNYKHMWGTMLFRKNLIRYIDPKLDHPGKQIQEWINSNLVLEGIEFEGDYMDIGTLKGLKELYRKMD